MTARTAPDLTRAVLLRQAPMIGASLRGIEAIAVVLLEAEIGRGESKNNELQDPFTPNLVAQLLGAAAALAHHTHGALQEVIGPDAESIMLWQGGYSPDPKLPG
jgi:hypothetical protein